jgi:hypothetical protein
MNNWQVNVTGETSLSRVRESTAWMQEVEQCREQMPRDGERVILTRDGGR